MVWFSDETRPHGIMLETLSGSRRIIMPSGRMSALNPVRIHPRTPMNPTYLIHPFKTLKPSHTPAPYGGEAALKWDPLRHRSKP